MLIKIEKRKRKYEKIENREMTIFVVGNSQFHFVLIVVGYTGRIKTNKCKKYYYVGDTHKMDILVELRQM